MSTLDMFIVFFLDQKKVDVEFTPDRKTTPRSVILLTARDEEDANDRAIGFFREYYNTYMDEARTLDFLRRQRACWVVERDTAIEYIDRVAPLLPNLHADMQDLGYRYMLYPMADLGFSDAERKEIGLQAFEAALKR